MQRIQYSAFIRSLRRDKLNSLVVDLKNLIKDLVENVQIFPICDRCFRASGELLKIFVELHVVLAKKLFDEFAAAF